jgi:serine/threonine protein kinase
LLVCDGIWSVLGDHGVRQILQDESDPTAACQALVSAAHLAGSQDNASAMLVRVDSLPQTALADTLAQLSQWPAPPKLRAGQTFEGWHVDGLVAESRQSLLYRVSDTQQRKWLLKTLPQSRHGDELAGPALLQEEWFLKRVAGRYFAEAHPLPQRQHLYYVQREYSGQTLAEHFSQQGSLSLLQWLELAPRLLRATGMLHRRNILHRDIKPENLLWGEDGELRMLDLGLAYCPGLSRDEAHALPGTPSYIAPEAFAGVVPNTQQDLYAVGVTLYYLLTGHYPYGEIEAFQHPRFGMPTPASRYRPDLPIWLDECLSRSVASNPQERFETAEEWLLVIERGEREAINTRPRPLLEREPLKVWRSLALFSLLFNLGLLVLLMRG